jgi:hypothetical protein
VRKHLWHEANSATGQNPKVSMHMHNTSVNCQAS